MMMDNNKEKKLARCCANDLGQLVLLLCAPNAVAIGQLYTAVPADPELLQPRFESAGSNLFILANALDDD